MTLVIETTIKKKQNYSHSQYQKNSQYLSKQNQNYRKVHQTIKYKSIKYNLQMKQAQTLQVGTLQNLQNCN